MIKSIKAIAAAAVIAAVPFSAYADSHKGGVEEVLVILSSDSLQTQGMAMVLSNTMAQQGAKVGWPPKRGGRFGCIANPEGGGAGRVPVRLRVALALPVGVGVAGA